MTMLLNSLVIAKITKMAILAMMATIAMGSGNFCMGIRGIQLKSTKKARSVMLYSTELDPPFRSFCNFQAIFTIYLKKKKNLFF